MSRATLRRKRRGSEREPGGRSRPCGSFAVEPVRFEIDRTAIERHLRKRSLRDVALWRLGIYTGRRIGDLLRLKVGDVALISGRGELTVKQRLEVRESKTGKRADLVIHQRARVSLQKYLRHRLKDAPSKGGLLLQPLFASCRKSGDGEMKPISRQRAGQILREAARAAGVEDRIACHSLRKTFGHMLHGLGEPLTLIGEALGHSNPSTTRRYIGLQRDDVDNAITALP